MEKQLVAAVGVLLPARELVVHGQRYAFFEAITCPCGKADDVAVDLETQGHVEIFGDVGFRPEFLVAVFVEVGDLLDGGPAEDGVVTDERRYVAVGYGVLYCGVDEIGEECDARIGQS